MNKIIISLDFELGWGVIESNLWKERERRGVYKYLREDMKCILERADHLHIPMVFAPVGAMIQTESQYQFSHLPPIYRESVEKFVGKADVATVSGIDLMKMILASRVRHEIGTHTYSHLHALHREASDEILRSDLLLSIHAISEWCSAPTSLIFPRDQVFSDAVLVDSGIEIVRRPEKISKGWLARQFKMTESSNEFASWGGAEQTGSLFLNWSTGGFSRAKEILVKLKAKRTMIDRNCYFHLWLHPFNWSETPRLKGWFLDYLDELATARDLGLIEIITMKKHREELGASLIFEGREI